MITMVNRKPGWAQSGKVLLMIATIFSLALADATISVDWNTVKYAVNPLSYSICGSYAYQASQTTVAGYRAGMKYYIGQPNGGTALLRLHRQAIVGAWSPGGVWNATTVISALTPLINDGFVIMIDFDRAIGGNAMDIAPADAADLVRIVNVTGKLGVKYWEIFNENAGDGASRGTQVKACSQAMKAVDSTIKVGGPGRCRILIRISFQVLQPRGCRTSISSPFTAIRGGSTSTVSDATIYDWAWGMEAGSNSSGPCSTRKARTSIFPFFGTSTISAGIGPWSTRGRRRTRAGCSPLWQW